MERLNDRIPDFQKYRILKFFLASAFLVVSARAENYLPHGLAASINGESGSDPIRSVFLLPNERLRFDTETDSEQKLIIHGENVERSSAGEGHWEWTAPKTPGLYSLYVSQGHKNDLKQVMVQAFVMVPFSHLKKEILNGYRIGRYPKAGREAYEPPRGFIEVTRDNQDTLLSSHFRLKQFLCKQSSGWPKYVVLKERLISKLEQIIERGKDLGYRWTGFRIMSGYRTPFYNRHLGNVRFSRHLWGDAADLMIDHLPTDGAMDDLNGDGKNDLKDTYVLRDIVESMEKDLPEVFPVGGMGVYSRTKSHGSFVHVDTRGTPARWGNKYRHLAKKSRKSRTS